jgi:hypothetical protein
VIDYYLPSASNGGRATGADACLIATQSGTRATTNIPGYLWAQNYVVNDLGVSAQANINACHLIPQQVGGQGWRANLATCGRGTNAAQRGSTVSPMTVAEQKIVDALAIPGGQVVYYRVIPLYDGNRTVPTGFMMLGVGSRSGVIVDETVGNIVYDQFGHPHNLGTAVDGKGNVPLS